MNIYFFSRHNPDPQMVKDLGGITQQITGTISNISKAGDSISFNEMVFLSENERSIEGTKQHTIPANSIVVAVAPLPLQIEWLNAGVETLLIPQTKRELIDGSTVFSYTGLLWMKRIIIDAEQWAGLPPTTEQKHAERLALHK